MWASAVYRLARMLYSGFRFTFLEQINIGKRNLFGAYTYLLSWHPSHSESEKNRPLSLDSTADFDSPSSCYRSPPAGISGAQ